MLGGVIERGSLKSDGANDAALDAGAYNIIVGYGHAKAQCGGVILDMHVRDSCSTLHLQSRHLIECHVLRQC